MFDSLADKLQATLADVVAAVKAQGGAGLAVQGDMGVEADVERVFATVDAELGPLTARLCAPGRPTDDSLMVTASGRAPRAGCSGR